VSDAARTCIACREGAPRESLLRVVCAPDGAVVPDFSQKLPGRGAYLCWRRACLERGLRPAALKRALKLEQPPADAGVVSELAQAHLLRRIGELCGLLQRSGGLKSGAHTVDMQMSKRWLSAALLASDAGSDIEERVRRRCARVGVPVLDLPLTAEQFGKAVGKEVRSVAAVREGRLTSELVMALQRYRGLL